MACIIPLSSMDTDVGHGTTIRSVRDAAVPDSDAAADEEQALPNNLPFFASTSRESWLRHSTTRRVEESYPARCDAAQLSTHRQTHQDANIYIYAM